MIINHPLTKASIIIFRRDEVIELISQLVLCLKSAEVGQAELLREDLTDRSVLFQVYNRAEYYSLLEKIRMRPTKD